MFRWPWLFVTALTLVLGACTATAATKLGDLDGEREVVVPTPQGPPADTAAFELPSSMSTIRSVGELGFYYADVAGQMRLIAFDVAARESLYQVDAHPLGRIRGVGQDLIVDAELGLVFVTGTDDESSEDAGYLAALDAPTGSEVWRSDINYYSAQPRDCGSSICVRGFSNQIKIDKATGEVVDASSVTDRRVLLSHPDLHVTTSQTTLGRFDGLVGLAPANDEVLWTVSADTIEAAVGTEVDPGFGWAAVYDDRNLASMVFLARADRQGWATFGIDAAGDVTWGRQDLERCVESPLDAPPVACRRDPSTGQRSEILRLDASTGSAVWASPLDRNHFEALFDGRDLVVWSQSETEGRYQRIDLASGEVTIGARPALCTVMTRWPSFRFPDGEVSSWASATLYTLCMPTGFYDSAPNIAANAAALDLGGNSTWLVDDTGVPVARVDG